MLITANRQAYPGNSPAAQTQGTVCLERGHLGPQQPFACPMLKGAPGAAICADSRALGLLPILKDDLLPCACTYKLAFLGSQQLGVALSD